MRLDPEQPEIALDGTLRDPGGFSGAAYGPMGSDRRAALEYPRQQAGDDRIVMAARATRPLLAVEPGQAMLEETLAPVADRRDRQPELAGDRGVGGAVSRGQHDPRPANQSVRRRPRPHKLAKLPPLKLT
jgi:hypothetical protein